MIGIYWDTRASDYPERSLQPAFLDANTITPGTMPLRGVMMDQSKTNFLQIQHDRFFVNWRAGDSEYPRFSDRDGKTGFLTRTLREFATLSDFCERRIGSRPIPTQVELTKIDLVERGKHWQTVADLQKTLRLGGALGMGDLNEKREFASRFVEHTERCSLAVSLNTLATTPGGEPVAVRIETRATVKLEDGQLSPAFAEANDQANRAFFNLLEEAELDRFGGVLGGASR